MSIEKTKYKNRKSNITISVVIVNYKVKEYVANLLSSLRKAQHAFDLEIFVIDNASNDNSINYLKKHYPNVLYIQNAENLGFGKANNQAIEKATGDYILIINPDTLVSEDTLECMVAHMERHPKCGAAGCKILNPDGTFAPESKRNIPTLSSAFSKVMGLNNLFSRSKSFGQYYMNRLDENETSSIPVLSGSFMFWRADLLKELGGFDERFFMYGEDIDLCYRVQGTNYQIHYVPETSIIHYKGESTRKGDLRYIKIFNKALYQFFDKHYSKQYSQLFKVFIYIAIRLKTIFTFMGSNLAKLNVTRPDFLILNASIILGFIVRYALKGENIVNAGGIKYLWILALASTLYLLVGISGSLNRRKPFALSESIRNLAMIYAGVVLITFFVRDLAFTRLGLILGFVFGVILLVTYSLYQARKTGDQGTAAGQLRNIRILIVGEASHAEKVVNILHGRPDWHYEVAGLVSVHHLERDEKNLGSLSQLGDLITAYHIDQVFYLLSSISYKQMLKEIAALQSKRVVFKLIPESLDFMLGKSKVEYLESVPLVEVELNYSNFINRALKRGLDLLISVPLCVVMGALLFPTLIFHKNKLREVYGVFLYNGIKDHKWKNRFRLLMYVVSGKLSLVGSPIPERDIQTNPELKPGLTGLVQINSNRIEGKEEAESYQLYYIQNYSIWMDLDILVKSLYQGPMLLKKLDKT